MAGARDSLIEIRNDGMKMGETLAAGGFSGESADFTWPAMVQRKLVNRLDTWYQAFEDLLARPGMMNMQLQGLRGSALLGLQHKIASVWTSTVLSPSYFTSPPP